MAKEIVIEGRSDFDPHEVNPDMSMLGTEVEEGVYEADEPVKMYRDAEGKLIRTVPLSEVADEEEKMRAEGLLPEPVEAMEAPASPTMVPMGRHERVDVVETMAIKLLLWYQEQPQGVMYNPIYDGIPDDDYGTDPKSLHQKRGDNALKPASMVEILEWFTRIIGVRAEIVNEKTIGPGYKPDVLRIHREPLKRRSQ